MTESTTGLRLALAQLNPTVGAIDDNAALAANSIVSAQSAGAALVVLPELILTGYPPEDLLLKGHFLDACERALGELASSVEGIVALVGCPFRDPQGELHNGLAVLADGAVQTVYSKVLLPNYGVFDERRYFSPGPGARLLELDEQLIGLTVCEDVWLPGPPTSDEAQAGAALIVNASASPYHRGKGAMREQLVADRALENGVAMALCNMVGGQDELVFDGHSVIVDASGETIARAAQFESQLLIADLQLPARETTPPADPDAAAIACSLTTTSAANPASPLPEKPQPLASTLPDVAEVYAALTLGLADYARKNGFCHAVIGLSGGIDSALVALLAADALGPERVSCVVMPSPHSSDATQADARAIAANLGTDLIEVPIAPMMAGYDEALAEPFAGTQTGVAEENLQARIRGNIIMALSNKFGWLALTTGNKSEMSVGYATLYGDMAGGFAVIKDVPKMLVYGLTRFRNEQEGRELVPSSVIERPPTAELRPDQLDSDSLPDYSVLDRALEEYVEGDGGRDSMVAAGIDPEVAERVISMVDRAEYKRRQAPPGVKITPKAFGRDRRLPITNRFGG